jgi:hypothetical protein
METLVLAKYDSATGALTLTASRMMEEFTPKTRYYLPPAAEIESIKIRLTHGDVEFSGRFVVKLESPQ